MPITKSAEKAMRQSVKRRTRNLIRKEAFLNTTKEIKRFIAEGKTKEAERLIPLAYKAIDKATKTGVIKKNAAARKKSQLMRLVKNKTESHKA